MKQLQFYKYAATGLLFLNIAMLAFFFLTKPPNHPRGKRFKGGAIEILNLDKTQDKVFFELVKNHKQKMKVFNQKQKELLKPYFDSLIDSTGQPQNVIEKVEQLERQKIESIYQHFQDIKSILKKEQLSGFEEFMDVTIKRILPDAKENPHPPKPK